MGGETGSKKQLGKIMLQQKLVSPDQLNAQRSTPGRGSRVSMPEALVVLAEQFNCEPVDLTQEIIDLSVLKLIPSETATERQALPFRLEGEQLWVAMASPDDEEALEEIGFLAGKDVVGYIALQGVLKQTIPAAYAALSRKETHFAGDRVDDDRRAEVGLPSLADAIAAEIEAGRAEDRDSGVDLQAEPTTGTSPAILPPPSAEAEERSRAPRSQRDSTRAHRSFPPPPPTNHDDAFQTGEQPVAPKPGADSQSPELDTAFSEPPRPSLVPEESQYPDQSVILALADPDLRAALGNKLTATGLEVRHVGSDQGALAAIRLQTPSVLLLGVELAEMNGYDLCRQMRADQAMSGVPLIMVSQRARGWRFEADLGECFGVSHYFEHPFDVTELSRTVRLVIEGREPGPEVVELLPESKKQLDASMAAFEAGDLDEAITHLEAGASMTPDSFDLQYHLGLLYGRRADLFLAITALETAVERRPRHFSALKNLAVVYQRAGFRHRAVETWQRAMWVAPDDEVREGIKQHMIAML